MQRNKKKGQALIMAALAVGIVLLGAVGLAIDTAQLYAHRQMAQAAADAAAQAAILSIYNGTNVGSNAFASSAGYTHTCGIADSITPCSYARKNGFGGSADDTVYVDVPSAGAVGLDAGSLSGADPVNLIRVTVTRSVSTWFVPILGASAKADVKALAVAAIVSVTAPLPIIVLHPHMANALYLNGTTDIAICGGPLMSIQVNSDNAGAYQGGGHIDLSNGGPGASTSGGCPSPHGNGGDFGVFGGAFTDPGSIDFDTRPGRYIQPASIVDDPLAGILPPDVPTTSPTPVATTNLHGCSPAIDTKGCHLYTPGYYPNGIAIGPNDTALFAPGVYYMDNGKGFVTKANGVMRMCSDCTASSDPNILDGMLVYNKYVSGGSTPEFVIGGGGDVKLKGTPATRMAAGRAVPTTYAGMLLFQDRTSPAATHILGGGGCLELQGTLYATNTVGTISGSVGYGQFQTIEYHGNPCSSTFVLGEIITDALALKGTASLRMLLESQAYLPTRMIALVK